MRYYSVILININAGLIEIRDTGTPYTKREAQRYAKNQAFANNNFILCVLETREIIDRKALENTQNRESFQVTYLNYPLFAMLGMFTDMVINVS